jgi:hypothetical protein
MSQMYFPFQLYLTNLLSLHLGHFGISYNHSLQELALPQTRHSIVSSSCFGISTNVELLQFGVGHLAFTITDCSSSIF